MKIVRQNIKFLANSIGIDEFLLFLTTNIPVSHACLCNNYISDHCDQCSTIKGQRMRGGNGKEEIPMNGNVNVSCHLIVKKVPDLSFHENNDFPTSVVRYSRFK